MGTSTKTREPKQPTDWLPPKKARREHVPVLFDEEVGQRLADARVALVVAADSERAGLQAEVDQLQAEADRATVVFVFQALGQTKYADLQRDYPPSPKDLAEHKKAVAEEAKKPLGERQPVDPPVVDGDRWPPALIAASLVGVVREGEFTERSMTAEQVDDMVSGPEWNTAEVQALYDGALRANTTMRRASLGKGFGSTRR